MKKRILSILLALCMLFCLVPTTAFAAGETSRKVETEQELVDALADSSVDIITLKNDIAIGTTLTVNRKVTLDLNGYVLKMTGSGSVIILDNKSGITGDLTLIDSNPTAEHKFKVNGVEPWVLDDSGTETVYGGIITGGTGSRIFFSNGEEGGGVIIGSGALTMNGGNIVGCIANEGGGLFLSDGSFTMNAGSIVGCSTPDRLTTGEAVYGGIYAFGPMANGDTTGVITLTGGLIKNNGRYAINAVYKTTIYANGGEVYGEVYLKQACKITCLAEDNGITAFKGKTVIGGTSSVNPSHVGWGLFYGGLYIYGNTTGVIVTYKDGDSEYAKQVLPSGTLATRPDAPAATPGYTFGGWNKADGTAWDYASDKVTDNITLYAKWAANTYTITFDTAGGSEVITKTIEVTYGEQFGDMPVPKREGYVFLGWYDALVGGKCYGDSDGKSTSPYDKDVSITLYAQWAEAPSRMVYFNTCGGTMTGPVEVLHKLNTPIAKPDNPTKPGHTFNGWYTDSALTQAWNFDDWVTGELKLYAGWTVNQYTITFDTNGGSEIAPITQDYGTKITTPDNPTRKGYTFKGWDKEIPETMPAENITVKAQWKINQYTITFDTNGGSEIAPITQDYGTKITTPDNPTRKGYTFKGWDKEIPETMPAENITVKAQWEINQYTITFDTNGGSEIAPITQDYGTKITAPDNPTRKGYTFKGWDKEIPETMPAENITITARWKDTEKPTGEIIIGTNKWNEFLNELTFGIFFKDTQEVTINAVDNSGVVFVSYLVTDKELSEAELNSLVFRAYEEPFCIDPNGEYIVYVMLVDENINITYLRSDRITLDNIQPVISGIENGKIYCEAQTVIVDEKYVDTVTVNGTVVTLDADGGFVLPPTNGEQKIVVTDKAGNNAEMTVTVNNGHTFGEWVSDNDGKHTRKCTVDGCDAFETENCSGGNATCTEKAVCDVCGKAYGEFDGTNHEGGVQEWTTRTAFNHEQKWNCCGAMIVASEAHEWKDGVCRECGYVCLHNDADKDHVCDYCEKIISEHEDKDKNHICDYCKKTISAHEDATPEEIKKPDTVTAKPDDSKSPQTGDNSNLILWITLLIISGGVMKGVTAFGKSKKHSTKIKDK